MKYKCVIFDCDGVLVDSESISSNILIEMAAPLGLDIDPIFAKKNFSGISLENCFKYIEENIEADLPASFEKDFRDKTFAAFKKDLQPVVGIHELLNKITIPYCVASSGPKEKIKLNLTTTKLIDKFISRIFSAYEIGKWKPDPGVFLYAAEKMGFRPNDCVVTEDSMAGVEAAKAGGFDVYAFVNDGHENIFESTNTAVFHEMSRLPNLLNMA